MPAIDQVITWRPIGGFRPSAPYDGDIADYIFRGQNMILRGAGRTVYLETWQGVTNFNDPSPPADVALTGTIAGTGSTITGTGTLFTRELIPNQWILIANNLYQVYSIASDTSLTLTENLSASVGAGATAYRVQTVVEVDNARGNLIRGSIIRFPNGNLLVVGDGVVRLNGSTLTSSLTASKRLQVAVFNPANQQYSNFPLGMAVPTAAIVLTAVGGGTKNMQAGVYSVRIAPARTTTGGYNNPSPKTEVTLAVNDQIQITFPAMDTASGQDAWDVYVSLFTTGGGIEGPWYFYKTVTTADVSSAGGNYTIEYNDAEVSGSRLLTFNNDPPPDACFVATLQLLPILLSCNGRGRKLAGTAATTAADNTVTGTSTTFTASLNRGQLIYIDNRLYTVLTVTSDTSIEVDPAPLATASGLDISLADTAPGPVVRPAKPAINGSNVEAFPAEFKVAVDPPENIIGWVRGAQGRIFLMTENYLHLCSSTGNPDLPVTVRPFWRSGFRNPYSLIFVNDTLYGYTRNGPTRSVGDGDETIEEHSFAADVQSVFRNWVADRVQVGYDAKNEAVCFFHSGPAAGSTPRSTECLMYMLRLGKWSTTIIIENVAANRALTGVATVAGSMVLVLSGANYQWDTGTEAIGGYVATGFMDAGDPGTDKTLTAMQMTGYSTDTVNGGIWAASGGEDVPLTDLENGTNQDSGNLTFPQGNFVRPSFRQQTNVARARLFAGRVNISWDGSGQLGRLDELVFVGNLTERRY